MNWKQKRYSFKPIPIEKVKPGMLARLIKAKPWSKTAWVIGMKDQVFEVYSQKSERTGYITLKVPLLLIQEKQSLTDEELDTWMGDNLNTDGDCALCLASINGVEISCSG